MNTTEQTARNAIIAAAALVLSLASTARADQITLNARAEIEGTAVTLMDIADLEGRAAIDLAGTRITTLRAPQQIVDMAEVRRVLDASGVHWGKLTLRGATKVTITRRATPPRPEPEGDRPTATAPEAHPAHIAADLLFRGDSAPAIEAGEATASANPAGTVLSVDPPREPRNVRRLLVELILSQVSDDPANVRIRFEDDASPALDHNDADYRLEIAPIARNPVGRIPILVRRYQDERLVGTDRIRVDVEVGRDVVIARRNLMRDQTITASDIATERRWLDTLAQEPIGSAELVVGQRSVGMLREGAVITMNDIAAPVLVQRGQLVTVRVISGSLVLKTIARATADGALGDEVPMQNERTRQQIVATVTGMRQAVMSIDPTETEQALEQARGGAR